MNKFKKATKRIAAVGVAAAYAATTALAGGLNVQDSMVKDNKFFGSVVIGSAADASAANSVVAALKSQFSGDEEKVEISYKKEVTGGKTLSAVDNKKTLNFGETLQTVTEAFEEDDNSIFEDGDLKDASYSQKLELQNGEFDYRIFDEIDGEETAKAGLYYADSTSFATYTLDFTDDLTSTDNYEKYIGEKLTIMGNEFTVTEMKDQEVTLIGGSNKVSLGEGETTKVTIAGKEYAIEVQSVSTDKVLLTINGESKSIDEFETEEVAGVSIAITDLVQSNRDAVKGYVELVLGGQKVELKDGATVKINDEKLDDLFEAYDVDVAITDLSNSGSIVLTYKTNENIVLAKGDELKDVLFDTFRLSYDGTKDVEYSSFKISTSKDEVSFAGNLFNGKKLSSEFKLTTDDTENAQLYLGSDSERIYHAGSDLDVNVIDGVGAQDAIGQSGDEVTFDIDNSTSDVNGYKFFSRVDEDEFYLYEISGVDKNDVELDFTDIFANKDTNGVDYNKIQDKLDFANTVFSGTLNNSVMDVTELGTSELYLENELMMNFAAAEEAVFNKTNANVLSFKYNTDLDSDDSAYGLFTFDVTMKRATDFDTDAIELTLTNTTGAWATAAEDVEDDSDYKVYVDGYGTKMTVNDEDKDSILIEIPNKEVEAKVSVNFGEGSSTMTKTVLKADAEEAKAALVKEGYEVLGTEVIEAGEAVAFDITSAITADETTVVENMIVIGGPIANAAAATLLGDVEETVTAGNAVIKYFEEENSVLIYGFTKDDTIAGAAKFNEGNLVGDSVNVEQ